MKDRKNLLPTSAIRQKIHEEIILQCRNVIWFNALLYILTMAASFLFCWIIGRLFPLLLFTTLLNKILITNVFAYSEHAGSLKLYRGENLENSDVFLGFHDYGRVVAGMGWCTLRTTLWGLVPVAGVVKYYTYSMTPYILCTHPELSPEQALQMSQRLTHGHKMELFVMDFSMIGWRLLALISFNVLGILYVYPYYIGTWTGHYLALAGNIPEKVGRIPEAPPKKPEQEVAQSHPSGFRPPRNI